jgi:hypothetical protein
VIVTLHLVLLAVAFACFLLAAAGVPARVAWEPLGLAFWVLTLLV